MAELLAMLGDLLDLLVERLDAETGGDSGGVGEGGDGQGDDVEGDDGVDEGGGERNEIVGAGGDDINTADSQGLNGTDGPDLIRGLGGNDELFGGGSDDSLAGGPGDDQLRGGRGADVFGFGDVERDGQLVFDGGVDLIEDFEPGVDRISFTTVPFAEEGEAVAAIAFLPPIAYNRETGELFVANDRSQADLTDPDAELTLFARVEPGADITANDVDNNLTFIGGDN